MRKMDKIITALVTPFNEDGTLDCQNLKKIVNFQKDKVDALFVLGSSGEGILMDLDQRKKALEIVLDENNNKVPIMAHVGCINTKDTVELTKHAVANKVDRVSAICPYFFKQSDLAIINHYEAVAKAAGSTPFFLYNNPILAANYISSDTLKYFCENVSNFAGIKDSLKSLETLSTFRKIAKDKTVLVGGDKIINNALAIGVDGAVSTLSNVYPELFTNLYSAFEEKDSIKVDYYQSVINKILDILFQFPYFNTIKVLLSYRLPSVSKSYCMKPILSLTEEQEKQMISELKEIEEIKEYL